MVQFCRQAGWKWDRAKSVLMMPAENVETGVRDERTRNDQTETVRLLQPVR